MFTKLDFPGYERQDWEYLGSICATVPNITELYTVLKPRGNRDDIYYLRDLYEGYTSVYYNTDFLNKCHRCESTITLLSIDNPENISNHFYARYIQGNLRLLCNSCLNLEFTFCIRCARWFTGSPLLDTLCHRCIGQEVEQIDFDEPERFEEEYGNFDIRPYDYDVMWELSFIGEAKNNLYFGVEYEIKPTDEYTNLIGKIHADFTGRAICVSDGSLRDDNGEGIEVVSAPMPFKLQKEFWEEFFSKGYKYESYNTKCCSIHVHMSREAFSPLQLAKMKAFFNSHNNIKFIEKIAGRDLTSTHWGLKYAASTEHYPVKYILRRNKYAENKTRIFHNPDAMIYGDRARYVGLNLTNDDTVEVRIFRGCNKLTTMYKNIEFCKAMYDFTKSSSVSVTSISNSVPQFIHFIQKFRKAYPYLNKFVEKHELLEKVKVKECVL